MSFFVWLTSQHSPGPPMWLEVLHFLWLSNIPHPHTHPHLLYPFICWWTLWLLLYLGNCIWCCYEHWGACIFPNWSSHYLWLNRDFPGGSDGKESACNVGDPGSIPGSGRSPGEGNNNPLQHACLEKYHGWRSLAGYNPWGCKESDTTQQLHYYYGI